MTPTPTTPTWTLLVLASLSACGEEPVGIYHTPWGPEELIPLTAATGLRVGGPGAAPRVGLASAESAVGERLPAYVTASGRGPFIADEGIRARFSGETAPEDVTALVLQLGGVRARPVRPELGIYDIRAETPHDTVRLADALSAHALWAHPDFFHAVQRSVIPNDTYLHEQWHHSLVRTPSAWDRTQGAPEVAIAVLDNGIDMTHPDLAEKLVAPFDALDNDEDPSAEPDAPHGTACAGLAAAVTGNGAGVAGVCPNCSLMPVRMEANGVTRASAASDAFYWAVDHGARVISSSWSTELSHDLATAMEYAANQAFDGRGAVLLFAAGNDGEPIPATAPAAHPDVLAIGATNSFDIRESYSNHGADLDLSAPAGSMTTDLQGVHGYAVGDYTNDFHGTSAATPVAAGVVGLLLTADPSLTAAQIATVLRATAVRVDDTAIPYAAGRNEQYGFGRIDATAALRMLSNGFGRDCAAASDCGPQTACHRKVGGVGGAAACTFACSEDAPCPNGMGCRPDEGCFPTCNTNIDCDPGSACWPGADVELGHCMPACRFDSQCGSEACNDLGLCGNRQPPGQAAYTALEGYDVLLSCRTAGNGWLATLIASGFLFARRRRA